MLYQTDCVWEDMTQKRSTEQYMGARLLHYALFSECGDVKNPVLERESGGKPYLRDYPHIAYNLTHTTERIYLYLRQGAEGEVLSVGVDAEPLRKIKNLPALAKKVLSTEERSFYEACEPSQRDELFLRFWTLKESFLKAIGWGIRLPLSSVSFSFEKDGSIVCKQELSEREWHFLQFQDANTLLSICESSPVPLDAARHIVRCGFESQNFYLR
ncbi:MAG: 4'-phosphopantetheinyl transferase superfamily protein [bacterium]|nr:4'-phosphopantetheinyl transferase superfamily protein [bacterium]